MSGRALSHSPHEGLMSPDTRFMRRALSLAARAWGRTAPNPMVGAVVVKSGRVIAEGYHRKAGAAHAEVEALRKAGARARGAALYVTLEPCAHTGRTGPCVDAILASGIRSVIAAARDPNPSVNGKGLGRLRRAGVRVRCGLLEEEAITLNAPFFKWMRTGLPWVVAKVGQSLDGKIATRAGESRWITSDESRRQAHRLRAGVDAVLVGANTIRRDDPLLTVRGWPHREGFPVKVIVAGRRPIPKNARCLSPKNPALAIIATPSRGGRVPLRLLMRALGKLGVQSVLIEGGGEVLASAFAERIVDHAVWFIAPRLIGGTDAPGSIAGKGVSGLRKTPELIHVSVRSAGPDLCVEADVCYPGTRNRGTVR